MFGVGFVGAEMPHFWEAASVMLTAISRGVMAGKRLPSPRVVSTSCATGRWYRGIGEVRWQCAFWHSEMLKTREWQSI